MENKTKPTFLKSEKPLIVAMIQCSTPNECIEKITKSLDSGADALGIQLCRLKREYRTSEYLRKIFGSCRNKPIYVTSYRGGESEGYTDDECAQLLLLALDCGATLLDVMGDMFERSPKYEIAESSAAIEKQKKLIDEIHRRGGEVLMSSHTYRSISVDENLMIARAQESRGADILKIVDGMENIDELPGYVESIIKIRKSTDKKLLFLLTGGGRIIRYIGPNLGVCMYLCVESHSELDTPDQPLIKDIVAVRNSIV